MDTSLPERVWVAACSHRLHRQWHTVPPDELEQLATELYAEEELRPLDPVEAAVRWLRRGLPLAPDA